MHMFPLFSSHGKYLNYWRDYEFLANTVISFSQYNLTMLFYLSI